MIRLFLMNCLFCIFATAAAKTIPVKNSKELSEANKIAAAGDIIILQNGEWKDVEIKLTCAGEVNKPITFKAETSGKVVITGHSQLKLGGSYIIVEGLYFTNGYAGDNTAVINFRTNKENNANHCRVTDCSIYNFNNPRRMDDNNWVSFSGKNNRLDHCSFQDKKNIGVLLAVILDDDESRENFHSIDHNYFGPRPPLGSNGGEMIRVGVSQHCQFNSNTQITDNFFDRCDGETEIVSIKSGSNIVRNNVFKECQGGVVLRHGDNNTVENNIFWGNYKEGTGGVRVINKGQWVINNFFYCCRGVDFRSPLSVMNGVPNSAAFRYVQVTDAVIANNTFVNCSPISFCEGSDKERSLPPDNVSFMNNVFYNDRDSIIYHVYDNINGFNIKGNEVSRQIPQKLLTGFIKSAFTSQKYADAILPVSINKSGNTISDSIQQLAKTRIGHALHSTKGFSNLELIRKLDANAYSATGNKWFRKMNHAQLQNALTINCSTPGEIYAALSKNDPAIIRLTGNNYMLDKPLFISTQTRFIGSGKKVAIKTSNMPALFIIKGNGNLFLDKININGDEIKAAHFITSDSNRSDHYNLSIKNCTITGLNREAGCEDIFYAAKSMIADSIVIRNNIFMDIRANGIVMSEEKDDKGYYNAEKITFANNQVTGFNGTLINIYRGGNDESTMGPYFSFVKNKVNGAGNTKAVEPLFMLTGVQQTRILSNSFENCNTSGILATYKDIVRANHIFEKNTLHNSGNLQKNSFVTEKNNAVTN